MPVVTRSQSHAVQAGDAQPAIPIIASAALDPNQTYNFAPPPRPTPAAAVLPQPPAPEHLPHEHLRHYVQSAKIQKAKYKRAHPVIRRGRDRVPPHLHLLSIEPDSRFRLRQIWIARPPNMGNRILEMIRRVVPSQPIPNAESRGIYIRTANFSLPAQGFWTFIDPLPEVDSAITLAKHTMRILETAERVVNLVWPEESKGLMFTSPTESAVPESDTKLITPLYYQKVREQDLVSITEPMVKMVVLVAAPWALSYADLQDTLTQGFPIFQIKPDGTRPKFSRGQKIIAQIYDCCTSQNSPFFILTTHEYWVFGSFDTATGWTRMVCTTIMEYNISRPSILEWVTYWCASALKLEKGWSNTKLSRSPNPEVANPEQLQIPYTDPGMSSRDWLITYSESWDFRTVSETKKIEGHPNCYITKF